MIVPKLAAAPLPLGTGPDQCCAADQVPEPLMFHADGGTDGEVSVSAEKRVKGSPEFSVLPLMVMGFPPLMRSAPVNVGVSRMLSSELPEPLMLATANVPLRMISALIAVATPGTWAGRTPERSY